MSVATVLLVVVSAVLVATGLLKLVAAPPMVERAQHLGYPVVAFRAVGSLELLGVAGLWVGRAGSGPLATTALVALLVLMAGAVVSHLRVGDGLAAVAPALVVAALLVALLALGVAA
jgi:hypothetical protein